MGKSRVIATAGLIALTELDVRHVHFVTPTKMLSDREKEEFQDYWALCGKKISASYHSNLDFEKHPDDLIFIDEVDTFVLDDPQRTDELLGETNSIGFTATVGDDALHEIEMQVLKDLRFKVTKHYNQDRTKRLTVCYDRTIPFTSEKMLFDWITERIQT